VPEVVEEDPRNQSVEGECKAVASEVEGAIIMHRHRSRANHLNKEPSNRRGNLRQKDYNKKPDDSKLKQKKLLTDHAEKSWKGFNKKNLVKELPNFVESRMKKLLVDQEKRLLEEKNKDSRSKDVDKKRTFEDKKRPSLEKNKKGERNSNKANSLSKKTGKPSCNL